eukprot:c26533_g1_i1 orf=219-1526(+)
MGLIDVVREAQKHGLGGCQSGFGLCLKPFWLNNPRGTDGRNVANEQPQQTGETDFFVCPGSLPVDDDCVRLRIEEEEKLSVELIRKIEQVEALSPKVFEELVRPYLEKTLSESRAYSFVDLLKRAVPLLGRKLVNAFLQVCVVTGFWNGLLSLLESQSISGYAYPELVPKLVERNRAFLLSMWLTNVHDPRPSDLFLVLKFFLKDTRQSLKACTYVRKQWRQMALAAIKEAADEQRNEVDLNDGTHTIDYEKISDAKRTDSRQRSSEKAKDDVVSKAVLLSAAVDGFSSHEICLHYIVASGQDEAVLASIVSQLDTGELLRLLQYLTKWLKKYSALSIHSTVSKRGQGPRIPTLNQILQLITVILDEHYPTLVLSAGFHSELKELHCLIKEFVDIGFKASSLAGVTEHLRSNADLPLHDSLGTDARHFVEYLDIG